MQFTTANLLFGSEPCQQLALLEGYQGKAQICEER